MYLSNDMSGMNNNGLSSGMHMNNSMQHQQQQPLSSQSLLAPIANYSMQVSVPLFTVNTAVYRQPLHLDDETLLMTAGSPTLKSILTVKYG